MNWRVRMRNPVFWVNIALAAATPVLAYFGLSAADFTTWGMIWETLGAALLNPYVVGLMAVGVWNALNDPTTKGIGDSARAMMYEKPNT